MDMGRNDGKDGVFGAKSIDPGWRAGVILHSRSSICRRDVARPGWFSAEMCAPARNAAHSSRTTGACIPGEAVKRPASPFGIRTRENPDSGISARLRRNVPRCHRSEIPGASKGFYSRQPAAFSTTPQLALPLPPPHPSAGNPAARQLHRERFRMMIAP